jgi:hypothetical protein
VALFIIFFMELGFQGFFLSPFNYSHGGAGWDAFCQKVFLVVESWALM